MAIDLPKELKEEAVASIQQYSAEHFDEPLGNLAAGSLLDYFLQEIGPCIYNQAIADAQERLQVRVMELDVDAHEPEFQYSHRVGWMRRGR